VSAARGTRVVCAAHALSTEATRYCVTRSGSERTLGERDSMRLSLANECAL
jgi:hypothetical protein